MNIQPPKLDIKENIKNIITATAAAGAVTLSASNGEQAIEQSSKVADHSNHRDKMEQLSANDTPKRAPQAQQKENSKKVKTEVKKESSSPIDGWGVAGILGAGWGITALVNKQRNGDIKNDPKGEDIDLPRH